MGLEQRSGATFVNVSEGKLYIKPKGEEKKFFDSLSGTISKIEFETDEYEGKKYEVCKVFISDGDDTFCLKMRVLSGYFRDFANSIKTGNPTEKLRIMPSYKDEKASMFIQQNNEWLKRYSTKDHPMDVPKLKQVKFRGEVQWDGSEQTEYWKKWLLSLKFTHPVMVEAKTPLVTESEVDDINDPEEGNDLPF